jgi:hypothetical protein
MEPGVLLLPYNTPLIFPILSQINPGHETQSTALTTTLILSCHLIVRILGGILPSVFPTKPHYKIFFPLYVSHHPSILGYPNNFSRRVSCRSLLRNICPVLFNFFFLTVRCFPQSSNILSLWSPLNAAEQLSHPHLRTGKIMVMHVFLTWYFQITKVKERPSGLIEADITRI